jgi:hypothetical protein
MKGILYLMLVTSLSSCAVLYRVQVGEMESLPGYSYQPFEIKVSELGFDMNRASNTVKTYNNNKDNDLSKLLSFIALFQMGPRTGLPVYNKDYAKNILQVIYKKCPSGQVTGLISIRENRDYNIISGEIIKIKGFCLLKKGV